MTPNEKALQICQEMGVSTLFAEDCNNGITLPLRVAKICALIAVNEIIEFCPENYYNTETKKSMKNYWEDVKAEIVKL